MHLNTFCVLCTVKANKQKKERTKTYNKETGEFHNQFVLLTPFRLGFLRVAQLGGGGGGGGKCPRPITLKLLMIM